METKNRTGAAQGVAQQSSLTVFPKMFTQQIARMLTSMSDCRRDESRGFHQGPAKERARFRMGGYVTSCGKSVQCWDVNPNASLDAILTWCLQVRRVNRLLLTTPLAYGAVEARLLAPEVEDLVAQLFKNLLLRSVYATEWPAVQLVGHVGRVFVVKFDEDVKEIMVATENALNCWVFAHRPPLPEDICAYREGDPYPALVSVTHEGDAWLLHDGEIDDTLASPNYRAQWAALEAGIEPSIAIRDSERRGSGPIVTLDR